MINDKWSMFKNYMHNELQISKEDIRVWMREAIQIEAEKIIKQSFGKYNINDILKDIVKRSLNDNYGRMNNAIERALVSELVKQLSISVEVKE